jgi:neopullulanase
VGDAANARTGVGLSEQQLAAQAFVRKLFNWRKTQAAVHTGRLLHYAPDLGTYVYFRTAADQGFAKGTAAQVMVVLNKNDSPKTLATDRFREALGTRQAATDVLTGQVFDLSAGLQVPARGVLLLETR